MSIKTKKLFAIIFFAMSVNDVEKATGIDFFVNLPSDIKEKIKNQKDISMWSKLMEL